MSVKDRLKIFISYLELTNQRFEAECGLSNGYIANMRKGVGDDALERISNKYPQLNKTWLVLGEGEMLKNGVSNSKSTSLIVQSDKIAALRKMIADIQRNGKRSDKIYLIPILNIDAVGGNNNDICDTSEYIEELIPVKGAKADSVCIPVSGDSMMPIFNPGDLVVIDEVAEWAIFLEMGQYYVIVLKDGRRLIKKIIYSEKDRDNYFMLVSENSNYQPVELPKQIIQRVFIVTQKHQKLTL